MKRKKQMDQMDQMDEKTLKALEGSIKKWEGIVAGTEVDEGVNNCPLCHLFFANDCIDCPVANNVLEIYCNNTPFVKWEDYQFDKNYKERRSCQPHFRKVFDEKSLEIAKEELEFLKSLLPDKSK